jgi:hypothetical protein
LKQLVFTIHQRILSYVIQLQFAVPIARGDCYFGGSWYLKIDPGVVSRGGRRPQSVQRCVGFSVIVRLAPSYRVSMWLLAPLTLGLGTGVLWLLALRWPRRIDRNSLILRSGRQVPWAAIRKIAVLKDARAGESRTIRLEIHCDWGIIWLPLRAIADGERVAAEIRGLFGAALSTARASDAAAGLRPHQVFAPQPRILKSAVG